jgi:hypothetical protein
MGSPTLLIRIPDPGLVDKKNLKAHLPAAREKKHGFLRKWFQELAVLSGGLEVFPEA